MSLHDRIKEARKNKGITQEELGKIIGVAKTTVTGYEKNREPTAAKIGEIADALGVDANFLYQDEMNELGGHPMQLQYGEMEHIKKYRFISEHSPDGATMINTVLDREYSIARQLKEKSDRIAELEPMLAQSAITIRMYAYMNKIASAGSGFYFDDIPTDTIEAPYCKGADFIIGVNGDSMEPDYHDGDKLYIQKAKDLSLGDVGIFTAWNECFVKELGERGLISKNPTYDDIPGTEDVRLIGRVLGKVETD